MDSISTLIIKILASNIKGINIFIHLFILLKLLLLKSFLLDKEILFDENRHRFVKDHCFEDNYLKNSIIFIILKIYTIYYM